MNDLTRRIRAAQVQAGEQVVLDDLRARGLAEPEVLAPEQRGIIRDWNHNMDEMPKAGSFEVMRIYPAVYRHMESFDVIEPGTGRMFRPVAWRKREA
jgi:hypothetical protein